MTDYERLKKKIAQIEQMNYLELCSMFAELISAVNCPTNPRTLKNRLIYKVQEMHLGGIAPRDQQLLIEISEQQNTCKASNTPKPLSTSVIHYVREWKGKKYDVTKISDKCYELAGVQYKSLSAVARAITGTRWNGKLFFGVKK